MVTRCPSEFSPGGDCTSGGDCDRCTYRPEELDKCKLHGRMAAGKRRQSADPSSRTAPYQTTSRRLQIQIVLATRPKVATTIIAFAQFQKALWRGRPDRIPSTCLL